QSGNPAGDFISIALPGLTLSLPYRSEVLPSGQEGTRRSCRDPELRLRGLAAPHVRGICLRAGLGQKRIYYLQEESAVNNRFAFSLATAIGLPALFAATAGAHAAPTHAQQPAIRSS